MTRRSVPVELVFAPDWWSRHYGVSFDEGFYLDRRVRIECDLVMRRALYERFGLGEAHPAPRPVIGSMHVAGGFVLPALFGVEIHFAPDRAPWPVPAPGGLSREQILALHPPDLERTWPMDVLMADLAALEGEFGCAVGDVDSDGILNTALHLRGEQLLIDFREDPELVHHLFSVLAATTAEVASTFRRRTGTCAVATNRSILNVDPGLYLHSNCSVQMISPASYRRFLLPYERAMADRLRPYGIHHCGDNLQRYAAAYAEVGAVFYDVGWGSDVAQCRQALPDAFLNLRLSPVRLLQESAQQVREDVLGLLDAAGPSNRVGVCCINMDAGTPDENVFALLEAARVADSGWPRRGEW